MIFELISLLLGFIKLCIFKIFNLKKIKFKLMPKMNHSFKIAMKKNTKLIIGKNFKSRNHISFRIYNEGKIKIGDNCFFNDGCSINCQEKIIIGNNVMFGQNVMIFDHDHDYKNNIDEFIRKSIHIGNNVWVGANVVILKGVTIGDNVVIAAGSVVRKDIESNTLLYQEKKDIIKKVI
ncbi:acyltransferase [Turicibacter sanguinis]|uniref:acyltransferase n=1 Tax=Turicibacter sanguinis TaxID=154288 RepID=UPI0012BCD317|nr:acyltransferase [Turicibacter sanguinis]MDB8438112.1 acyltransferase [Turicibacter sanguinis]MTN82434.1 acyltransferase [Turicibacter sanguinis]MTN85043.1 acyltransferase [Turicibacter sanguinis]MTN87821.1 acyltransferase [Turicibacter sanguinis]MTN90675.1 acyltransferase [Turicibacter sanguinis]